MTTIVCNTVTGAVTEYDWGFDSLTPSRAASPAGLFTLGGSTDAGAPIAARAVGGRTVQASLLRQAMGVMWFALQGTDQPTYTAIVQGSQGAEWTYPIAVDPKGVSRARAGRGIDENYLALGFANVAGGNFRLDAIDTQNPTSRTRRT